MLAKRGSGSPLEVLHLKNQNSITDWTAKWVWADAAERRPQNQTVIFRKAFRPAGFTAATLAITASPSTSSACATPGISRPISSLFAAVMVADGVLARVQ